MEIISKGIGIKKFAPEIIHLNFDFNVKSQVYDKALSDGVRTVDSFVQLLEKLGYKKTDFKTNSFRVYEEIKYDPKKQENVRLGYIYNHNANMEFGYDIARLADIVQEISKLKDGPRVNIAFMLKNEDGAKSKCIDLAFKNAKSKAEAIAKSAGKKLKDCKKVSFETFDGTIQSNSKFEGAAKMGVYADNMRVREAIGNVLVPEDIEIEEVLFCLFDAE